MRSGTRKATLGDKGSPPCDPGANHQGAHMGIAIIRAAATQAGFGAGAAARGEFHCTDCGYGIIVHHVLPTCPMCRSTDWQPSPSRRLFLPPDVADQHA